MAPYLAKYSILFPVLFTLHLSASNARDTIAPTQPLADNETLVSAGGTFALGFFAPSKTSESRYIGIWFNSVTPPTIVWVANRESPVIRSTGQLSVTANGTMMITDRDSNVVWSAGGKPAGLTNQVAVLLDTGNLVLMKQEGGSTDHQKYTWQGFDYPTDTLLPGMELGAHKIDNLNRTMTAWRSADDPSLGDYFASMGTGRNPELYLFAGSVKVWRSGPWNGVQLSGIPVVGGLMNYSFVNNDKEVTFSYQVSSSVQPIPPILKINQSGRSGTIQWLAWSKNTGQWEINWDAPANECDKIGPCGPYAICDSTKSPVCNCLEGFRQMDPSNWTKGCVRKDALACGDGTDVFVSVNGVKLPETTSSSLVSMTSSPDACRFECLKNCNCTGYAISAGGGGKCTIWVTELLDVVQLFDVEDIYVRLAAAYLASHSHSQKIKRKIFAIVASLLSGTLVLSCVIVFLLRRKKRGWVILERNIFFGHKLDEDGRRKDLDLPLFSFGTIEAATESFSDGNKLGQGGFGPVYKGTLGGDKEIAVKRLAKSSQQGTEEFKNEVMLIAKLQNRNLVRLLGCCIQGEERMLIYEYMPNKSLDAFLFGLPEENQDLPRFQQDGSHS